ncbi:hypothetical protein HG535_0C05930 [Zygotorulaspora mrakii]|uniref:Serine/threonine-protein kinase BUR1 n=1 Tax=Zygotorulaspora mrakii TaxID=42260 RepID=A0A7H9B2N4_ZYGMR|nr:uncharacterized protein HG535_0C05930 [Zygotorulaspora mrakii]QLG72239.1 hypothetical protein HG535_0C05930 [Zygotorulaspora mrakii]
MDGTRPDAERKTESKYKIGKVKQIPTVQKDFKSGLTYIELKAGADEKVYGCTKFAGHYREEKKLGQGTFGEVYKGVHLETQRQVAMKKIIVNVEKDLFPITAQREITILRRLDHKNVIKLIEMVYDYPPTTKHGSGTNVEHQQTSGKTPLTKSFYMILPYMVSDLSGILHNPRMNLQLSDIKNLMLQLLESINYIHCQKFMHRDIKTANILVDHNGVLKLADFGLARLYYGSPPNLKYPGGAGAGAKYTSVVVTRWYRAPELVLGDKFYTTAVDIWGVGCVFAECFEKKPILQGTTDIDQGHVIFKLLGTPSKEDWPSAELLPGAELTKSKYLGNLKERFGSFLDETGLDFLRNLLALDPYKRLTAMSAVHHPFFKQEPLPSAKLNLPCEESHEADIKRYKEEMQQAMSQKAPTAPRGHVTESKISSAATQMPKAPGHNNFPKGPAQKAAAATNSYRSNTMAPAQRQVSRYNGNSGNSGFTSKASYSNNYRQSDQYRFHPDDAGAPSSFAARLPKGPQSSRFQRTDNIPTGPAAYNSYGQKDAGYYDRSKQTFNATETPPRNYARHEQFHDRSVAIPRQPRNDTKPSNYETQPQTQIQKQATSQVPTHRNSRLPTEPYTHTRTQEQVQNEPGSQEMKQTSSQNQQNMRKINETEKDKDGSGTRDLADLY